MTLTAIKEALQFYADPKNHDAVPRYDINGLIYSAYDPVVDKDHGKKAREALAMIEGMNRNIGYCLSLT